ncbi:hypothetical protein FA13DRAFT_526170 [Coprinellus micaceus]|uniref:Nephrocystin 3-like N-terminal domain-containing protein n=1 Tax=Coprinellus micaceus TaxID=71717 RepID=A0A4Y7T930_COPMI|nr:hypothetical protein FA13DRAFT_526170 [Coprinellus micaceus]
MLTSFNQFICDPDSESRTLGSRVSVESDRTDEKSLNLAPQTQGTSILHGASRLHLGQLNYYEAPKSPDTRSLEGWNLLLGRVTSSALYNYHDQFRSPKCDEGTRTEVIDEIMTLLSDPHPTHGIVCVTGSSGAGKSALLQTIAEQLSRKRSPFATFFFSKLDPTRNNTSSVIPTIAYQLGLGNAGLRYILGITVADDPFLFTKSLQAQMVSLLIEPVKTLCSSKEMTTDLFSPTILIDGLNECADEGRQAELLEAINDSILDGGQPPFRYILSSRIGWAIQATFTPQVNWPEHIHHIHFTMNEKVD